MAALLPCVYQQKGRTVRLFQKKWELLGTALLFVRGIES